MSATASSATGRRLLRRALIAVVTVALLYLAAAFALSRFLDSEALASWLEPRLERAFNRDVELGRAEVGFLPVGVRLKEVTLKGFQGPNGSSMVLNEGAGGWWFWSRTMCGAES
jgi:hypothetical protein